MRKNAKITPGILTKLNKNEVVSFTMPIKICEALNCDIGDIVKVKNNNEVSVREHDLSTSINANILSGNAKIPFLLSLDSVWDEVYKEDDRTLGLEISFLLMNYNDVNYEQKISLEMANASNENSLTPAFINKKVSKSYITD